MITTSTRAEIQQTDRDVLLSELRQAGAIVKNASSIICPFHDDHHPSMSTHCDDAGHWRCKCHTPSCRFRGGDYLDVRAEATGKTLADILADIGLDKTQTVRRRTDSTGQSVLRRTDSNTQSSVRTEHSKPPRLYDALDALLASVSNLEDHYRYTCPDTGRVESVAIRIRKPGGGKCFMLSHQRPDGKWVMAAPPNPWPLLNRRGIRESAQVIVVEGEKCAKALYAQGFRNATTSPAGAGKAVLIVA